MSGQKKKKSGFRKGGGGRWWRGPLFLSLHVLPWFVVLGALAWSLWMGANTAWDAMTGHPAFLLAPHNIRFETPGSVKRGPMEELVREELRDVIEGAHIFDRTLPGEVTDKLLQMTWIKDVKSVRRMVPNELQLHISFRQPAGVVESAGQLFLIDRDGSWLPEDFYMAPGDLEGGARPVIVHQGLRRRVPPGGMQWEGKALPVGARLRRFLEERGALELLDIKEINVTRVGSGGIRPGGEDVSLLTGDGTLIGWGSTDEYENIGGLSRPRVDEPVDEQKLQRLLGFLEARAGLEDIRRLDLQLKGRITYEMRRD